MFGLKPLTNIDTHGFLAFCAPIPALALGVAAMRYADVASVVWLTNIAAAIAGVFLFVIVRRTATARSWRTQFALAAAAIAAILSTFFFDGIEGVHRWLPLGGLRVHASSIAAPVILVSVGAIARVHLVAATAIAIIATAMLALQPDAAQATSLAVACAVLLAWCGRHRRLHVAVGVTLLLGAALVSFTRRDPLQPVPHVEGILGLLAEISAVWMVLGVAALALLPHPFLTRFLRHRDAVSLALGVYVTLITVAPIWGAFPVPIMGYGVSPILGYFLALAFVDGNRAAERDAHEMQPAANG